MDGESRQRLTKRDTVRRVCWLQRQAGWCDEESLGREGGGGVQLLRCRKYIWNPGVSLAYSDVAAMAHLFPFHRSARRRLAQSGPAPSWRLSSPRRRDDWQCGSAAVERGPRRHGDGAGSREGDAASGGVRTKTFTRRSLGECRRKKERCR